MLGLPELLDDLGCNRRQRCCALATIAARMAAPGSERATNRWLRRPVRWANFSGSTSLT